MRIVGDRDLDVDFLHCPIPEQRLDDLLLELPAPFNNEWGVYGADAWILQDVLQHNNGHAAHIDCLLLYILGVVHYNPAF